MPVPIHSRSTDNRKIETGLGPITDNILKTLMDKLVGDEFKELLSDKIVDPVLQLVNAKIKPYIYGSIFLYVIVIILLLMIYFKKNKCQKCYV